LPSTDEKFADAKTPAVRLPAVAASSSPVIAVPAVRILAFVALKPVALAVALLSVKAMVLLPTVVPVIAKETDSMVDVTSAVLAPVWTDNSALPVCAKSTEVSATWLRTFVTVPALAVAAKLFDVIDRAEALVAPAVRETVAGVVAPSSVIDDVIAPDWL
jgi:hypothetical protein